VEASAALLFCFGSDMFVGHNGHNGPGSTGGDSALTTVRWR
jgi:hypothetical protein